MVKVNMQPVVDIQSHIPVMMREAMEFLAPEARKIYIDATFGRGGYTKAIFDQAPTCHVLAIDRDPDAATCAKELAENYPHLRFVNHRFSNITSICNQHGITAIDGAVFDIGVSSPQIDQNDRGFSFTKDGPLDMRMEKSGLSAAEVVNTYPEEQLADIIYQYGEERASRRIARHICNQRQIAPIETTHQLANIIRQVVRKSKDGIDPATRTFQALRIFVNDELSELTQGLEAALKLLNQNGRLVVIAFHSLEDRIVKQFFKKHSDTSLAVSRHMPTIATALQPSLQLLSRKPIKCLPDELHANPRASSARLRAAVKIISSGLEKNSTYEECHV